MGGNLFAMGGNLFLCYGWELIYVHFCCVIATNFILDLKIFLLESGLVRNDLVLKVVRFLFLV